MVNKITKFENFDDILISKYVSEGKLLKLVELGNISRKDIETKESLASKIIYESVYGLDEILNLLFTENSLKEIGKALKLETSKKSKNNIIGMIVKALPTKKKRKIETVIEESIEDTERLIIYNLFIMYKNGTCLFSYNLEPIDIGDSSLITSALNAIGGLLREITQINALDALDSIDVKEKELIFEYIGDIIGVLLVNKETKYAKRLLHRFLTKFHEKYEKDIYPWVGNIAVFEDAADLVKEDFASYFVI